MRKSVRSTSLFMSLQEAPRSIAFGTHVSALKKTKIDGILRKEKIDVCMSPIDGGEAGE